MTKRLEDPELDSDQLKPGDLRQLAMAQDAIIRNSRLLAGQTTANEGREVSGKIEVEVNGYLDDRIQEIIRSGDIEGQLKLQQLQGALQALIEG